MPNETIDETSDEAILAGAEVKSEKTVAQGEAQATPPASTQTETSEEVLSEETPEKSSKEETSSSGKEAKPSALSKLDELLGTTPSSTPKSKEKEKETPSEKEKETTPPTQTQVQPPAQGELDLTEFGPQQQIWLKRMPSDARKYFAELIKEDKTKNETVTNLNKKITELSSGKQTLPENWNEHPEAYKLTEEYSIAFNNLGLASQIYEHYLQQAERIAAGEDWQPLEDEYDAQGRRTGKILIKPAQQVMVKDKVLINEYLREAGNQVQQIQGAIERLKVTHKTRHETLVGSMQELAKKYYPQFDDEKYEGGKILKQLHDELPKVGITKNNPAYDIIARSVALNYIYRNYIVEQDKKSKATQAVKQDAAKAGPNASTLVGGSSTNSGAAKKKSSLAELEKILN